MTDKSSELPESRQGDVQLKLHAIQLLAVQPMILSISVHSDPETIKSFEGVIQLESTHTEYNEQAKTIQVKVRALISEESGFPLSLHVEITGVFKVDESRFDKQYIYSWAKKNAPMVLYPFLREQVFSLSVRAGTPGIIVPLIEVPTFKIISPSIQY